MYYQADIDINQKSLRLSDMATRYHNTITPRRLVDGVTMRPGDWIISLSPVEASVHFPQ
jgi:hypothetical protein